MITTKKILYVITVPIRKGVIASQTKNFAPPGVQYAENASSKITFKTQKK